MTRSRIFSASLALVCTAAFSACSDDDDGPPRSPTPTAVASPTPTATLAPTPDLGEARVRVIHDSPDAPAVDVLVDDAEVLSGVPYGAASDYLPVPPGDINVKVRVSGTDTVVLDRDLSVAADTAYSALAINLAADIDLVVLEDDLALPGAGAAKVRAVHGAPSAPAVDIYVTGPEDELGDPTLTDVPYFTASPYLSVPTGDYRIRVTPADASDVVIDSGTVSVGSNVVISAIAVDAPGGGAPFDLLLLIDEAGAALRVVHASPDAPNVDVRLDGEVVLSDVAYRDASSHLSVSAGTAGIELLVAGTDTVALSADVPLAGGVAYSVLAINPVANLDALVITDDLAAPGEGEAKLRAVHAAPSAPTVDVYVTGPADPLGTPTLSGVPYPAASPFLTVADGDYRIRVTPEGTTDVAIDSGTFNLGSRSVRTGIAIDAPGGGTPFEILLLEDLN